MRAQGVINANYPRDPARTRVPGWAGAGGGAAGEGGQSRIKASRQVMRVGGDKAWNKSGPEGGRNKPGQVQTGFTHIVRQWRPGLDPRPWRKKWNNMK